MPRSTRTGTLELDGDPPAAVGELLRQGPRARHYPGKRRARLDRAPRDHADRSEAPPWPGHHPPPPQQPLQSVPPGAGGEVVPPGYNPVSSLMEKPTHVRREARWVEVHDAAVLLEVARRLPPLGGSRFSAEVMGANRG